MYICIYMYIKLYYLMSCYIFVLLEYYENYVYLYEVNISYDVDRTHIVN